MRYITDPECPEYMDEVAVMAELLINIPKPEMEAPKPVPRAPVHVKTDGLIDDELLRYVAGGKIFGWLETEFVQIAITR